MIGKESQVLQSDAILVVSTKGKDQFFTFDRLYQEMGVPTQSLVMTLEQFRAFLKGMTPRHLLSRSRVNPTGAQNVDYTSR